MSTKRLFWILAGLNVLWAPTNGMLKLMQNQASPSALVALRWGFFAALLWAAVLFPPTRKLLKPTFPAGWDRLKAMLIGLFCVSLSYLLYCYALTLTSSIETVLLCTSYPVVMAVLAFLYLKEHVTRRRWVAIAIGVVGAYIVGVGFQRPSMSGSHTLGNLIVVLALLLECTALAMATKIILRSSGLGVLAFEATGSALGCLLYPLVFPRAFPIAVTSFSPSAVLMMAYLALVAGIFAFGVWYVLVEKAPVSLMMISTLIQPPVAAVFGVLLLSEKVLPNVYAGSVFIAVALLVSGTEKKALGAPPVGADGVPAGGERNELTETAC